MGKSYQGNRAPGDRKQLRGISSVDKLYVLSNMAGFPAQFRAELLGLDREVLHWKPSDREWSLAEVMAHLADSDEIFYQERALRMVQEDNPSFPPFDEAQLAIDRHYNEQDATANLARLATWNARLVALGWEADWSRTGTHTTAGLQTLERLLIGCLRHYTGHLGQMRRIKSQYLIRM